MSRQLKRATAVLVVSLGLLAPADAAAQGFPRAHITSGPSGEVPETTATFAFEATNSAPLGSFECRLDGTPWGRCTSPVVYENLTGGAHRFEVRLVGLLVDSTPDERTWTVQKRTVITPEPIPPKVDVAPPVRPDEPRRDAEGCAYGHNQPGEVSDARLERAAICLVNRERAERGLRGVVARRSLQRAAALHAADMVDDRYFAHVSRAGHNVADRARRTGYLDGVEWWTVGEVLVWSRPALSPFGMVRAWLRSRPHRRVLLNATFRDIGMAIAHGTPRGHRRGATGVGVFGRRG